MKKLFYTLGTVAVMLTAACSQEPNEKAIPDAKAIVIKTEYAAKMDDNRAFALDFFKTVVAESNGDNLFVSPYSVNTALNMLWNGAAGNTADEIAEVLCNSTYTKAQINDYSKTLTDALLTVDPTTEIRIANSIWADLETPFRNSFVTTNQTWYDAEVRNVDFGQQSTLKEIDDWCSAKTNKKIDKISEGMKAGETKFALINAIYFKAKWKHKFKKSDTASENFTNADGKKVKVDMMNQTEDFRYADDDADWKMLSMPYGNRAFSMVILMPFDDDKNLDQAITSLTAEKYYELFYKLDTYDVTVKLPKFKAEYTYDLHEKVLPQMGMIEVFNENMANLSEMCGNPMYVKMVKHKTYIDVYEEGTEAAAVTSVSGDLMYSPGPGDHVNFYVDRPFIYSIVEKSTGTILFMGRVNNF